jgi:hypothetical protein
MAATISLYNHLPELILNKQIDFTKIRCELLNNTATFTATHTAKASVDNGASAVITAPVASPGLINWTAHAFSAGQAVKFKTSGALPTGLVADTYYYVIAAGLVTNAFEVSATPGGSAINFTGSTSGIHTGYSSGSYEVYGNGWVVGGPTLASVAATQAAITDGTNNDAKLSASDIIVTASGGTIGPAFKALLYDDGSMLPLAFIDFGGTQSAGDTTDFKIRWNANGIFNVTM